MRLAFTIVLLLIVSGGVAPAAERGYPVEEVVLENGMKLLLLERPGSPLTAAAWMARVGSADEQPGTTGMSHLIEHLMYKGSERIGSRDPQREAPLLEERDRLELELRSLAPEDPARERLERRVVRLDERLRELHFKGEYALHYTEAGAVGLNALTREDVTLYYGMVPSPRLELWFWLESDRLAAPAFRELYDEYAVVDQERLQRIDSRPEGPAREAFNRAFWGTGHPYSWPAAGLPEDLRQITRPAALTYFRRHYGADGLAAALVGDYDRERIEDWAERYFGRLEPRETTEEPGQRSAETAGTGASDVEPVRMTRRCECTPGVELRYRTVPFGHEDAAALDVLAGLLAGRTGRLHRGLVLERGVAFAARAVHAPLRRAGSFSVEIEARRGVEPETLEAAWLQELERLREGPIPERELEKVKNGITTDAARQIEESLALALRLLVYEALGDWRHLYRWPEETAAVETRDVRRVIERYFAPERRSVLVLERSPTSTDAVASR